MLPRKIWHALGAVIVVVYEALHVTRPVAAGLLLGITAILLFFDLGRHRMPALQDLFQKKLKLILDEKDLRGLNGSTLYFGGCALAVALFPKGPACAGILALALGDPSAALVGSNVRSLRLGKKSLAGSATCLVVATLAARLYFPWPVALAGGVAATLIEALAGSKLDNLAIPLGTALVLFALGTPT